MIFKFLREYYLVILPADFLSGSASAKKQRKDFIFQIFRQESIILTMKITAFKFI